MKRNEYRSGLRVKQRATREFCLTRTQKEGITISEGLTTRRAIDKEDYCQVRWDGSSAIEFVHYNAIEILSEVAA